MFRTIVFGLWFVFSLVKLVPASGYTGTLSLKPLPKLEYALKSDRVFALISPDKFFEHRKKIISGDVHFVEQFEENWNSCVKKFSGEFKWPNSETEEEDQLVLCMQIFLVFPDKDQRYFDDLVDLIKIWSTQPDNPWHLSWFGYKPLQWYSSLSFIANLAQWYTFYESKLPYNQNEHATVKKYLKTYLLDADFDKGVEFGKQRCPEQAEYIAQGRGLVDTDYCGSVRFKVATGKIALGFKLNDKDLMKSGFQDLEVSLNAHDEEGYFVPYSPNHKQGYAFSYYYRQAKFLSVLVELFAMRGYDFLHYKMPHGSTVKESIDFNWNVSVNDHRLLGKYPGDGSFYAGDPWSNWNRLKNLGHQTFILENMGNDGMFDPRNPKLQFAVNNPRYGLHYQTAYFIKAILRQYQQRIFDSFSAIYPLSIMLGNLSFSQETLLENSVNAINDSILRESVIAEIDSAKQVVIDAKRDAIALKKIQARFEELLAEHGIEQSEQNGWQLAPSGALKVDRWEIYETKTTSQESKYRFRMMIIDENEEIIFKSKITLFIKGNNSKAGLNIKKLVKRGMLNHKAWKSVMETCQALDKEDENFMQVPIKTGSDYDWLQKQFVCILTNNEDPTVKKLLQSMVLGGQFMRANYQ